MLRHDESEALAAYIDSSMNEQELVSSALLETELRRLAIRLEFDQPESIDQYFVPSNQRKLAIHLRGNTVLDLSPRDHDPTVIPMMMRDHMKAHETPMHTVRRFASENILPLQ